MSRLFIVILAILCLSLKSDGEIIQKQHCDWTGVPVDKYGCVDFGWVRIAEKQGCSNLPTCFRLQVEEIGKKHKKDDTLLEIPDAKKEYFKGEDAEEKKKVMPILDSSAVALLKNSKLKDIKIIFYNKTGKLSKDFQKEAEQYLLDKGVKQDQFKIEIR